MAIKWYTSWIPSTKDESGDNQINNCAPSAFSTDEWTPIVIDTVKSYECNCGTVTCGVADITSLSYKDVVLSYYYTAHNGNKSQLSATTELIGSNKSLSTIEISEAKTTTTFPSFLLYSDNLTTDIVFTYQDGLYGVRVTFQDAYFPLSKYPSTDDNTEAPDGDYTLSMESCSSATWEKLVYTSSSDTNPTSTSMGECIKASE